MKFIDFLKDNIVLLDGAMGTLLHQKGLKSGELSEEWNLTHPNDVTDIHLSYFNAGSNVVSTNTFGVNNLKYSNEKVEVLIKSAVDNAKNAVKLSGTSQEKFIALDLGPTGKMLEPIGDLSFEECVSCFKKNVTEGLKNGVDLFFLETFTDSLETKAALLAVKELTDLPVLVSNAYNENDALLTGATPEIMTAMLEGMKATAIGANCSFGPDKSKNVISRLCKASGTPIIFKPNAGLPVVKNGKTEYDITPEEFAQTVVSTIKDGVCLVGGCCGTTPEHIKRLSEKLKGLKAVKHAKKDITCVCSGSIYKEFSEPMLIGERINPTGKKKLKQAIIDKDFDYIISQGLEQVDCGADILDVNVGVPGISEESFLPQIIAKLQNVISLPLQIDTSNPTALEKSLRLYNGKPMVNSVNGKKESMDAVFPLIKKYGGLLVALTLDENGIPETAQGRFQIAEKIVKEAAKYGIDKKDLIFDTLTLSISSDKNAAIVTLNALKLIRDKLNCKTVLGVSNVSFGMPERSKLNGAFLNLALENGLSAAIINPNSPEIIEQYRCYRALKGLDNNFEDYINLCSDIDDTQIEKREKDLSYFVIKGLAGEAKEACSNLLLTSKPLEIIEKYIMPALNEVGEKYEKGHIFLPQLLLSAGAAKEAFDVIKEFSKSDISSDTPPVVLATVKGDIHDIGKNIVKLLLENYGFNVIDLGKDVNSEAVLEAVLKHSAKIVGLSALMTTTLPAMEKTVKLIKEKAPFCKTVVGGAVLSQEYADKIGADKYAKDAMETVKYAKSII